MNTSSRRGGDARPRFRLRHGGSAGLAAGIAAWLAGLPVLAQNESSAPATPASTPASSPPPASSRPELLPSTEAAPDATSPLRDEDPDYGGYRPFGLWDYIGTGITLGAFYAVEFTSDGPSGASWTEPLPIGEGAVRDWVTAETREGRERADLWSDYLWYASVAYPVLDAAITPAVRSGSWATSWHMTMMNVQAFAAVSLLTRIPHKYIGRLRPLGHGCEDDPEYHEQCTEKGRFVSFFGGHLAVSMTGAGLSCAHHVHGELYGDAWADGTACAASLTAATLVGYLRMAADKHWLSDQLVGTVVGLGAGYALPTLLYYRPFWRDRAPAPATASRRPDFVWTVLPLIGPSQLGATFAAGM